jgi:hypothetical protein
MQRLSRSLRLFPSKSSPTEAATPPSADEGIPATESQASNAIPYGEGSGTPMPGVASNPIASGDSASLEEQPYQQVDMAAFAAEINDHHHKCEISLNSGLMHAIEAGRLLIRAKDVCPHGTWGHWLDRHFAGSRRTAQLYIKVARDYPNLGVNAQRVADLNLRSAVARLAKPDQRTGSQRGNRGQVQELIDAERSRPEFEDCQARIASLQRELSEAQARCRKLQSDIDEAQHELDVDIQNCRQRQLELSEAQKFDQKGTTSAEPSLADQRGCDGDDA